MIRSLHDVVIIGGGPAGLAAAVAAHDFGCRDVLLIERDDCLGGILNQCIHDGFGLHIFQEVLSGPEYAERFIQKVLDRGVSIMENSMVIDLSPERVLTVSRMGRLESISARAVVLAMGCRERTLGAISIPGHRPAGVYTAGMVQNLVNMQNFMPGERVCIVGSGDIGLIMARRMTLEGARVEAVVEIMPYSNGLSRNVQQCLADYGIPLYLSTTVANICGPKGRLEGIEIAQVDGAHRVLEETRRYIPCDTLLFSVGLIPENELSREAGVSIDPTTQGAFVDDTYMTSVDGIFACGNVLHVHDLVDFVSAEAAKAGAGAARYAAGRAGAGGAEIAVKAGAGVRYVMPQTIRHGENVSLAFRVQEPARDGTIQVLACGGVVKEKKCALLQPSEMVWLDIEELAPGDVGEIEVRLI